MGVDILETKVVIIQEKLCNLEKRMNEVEELSEAIAKLYNELSKMNTSLQVLVSEFNNNKGLTIQNQENIKKMIEKPMTEFSAIKTGVVIGFIILVFEVIMKYI